MVDFVTPGDNIAADADSMPGYGTYRDNVDGTIKASIFGRVDRVQKLICVNAFNQRYKGSTGDIIVGRVSQVATKRWKVDIGGSKDAILALTSVDLPSGAQRIRSEEDELAIRTFYNTFDLLSAEVQRRNQDGQIQLQTRGKKFGKLSQGVLVTVPHMLVSKIKQRFVELD